MSSMTSATRALRVSTNSVVRAASRRSNQLHLRAFHESTKAKAVEATAASHSPGLQHMTPPPFLFRSQATTSQNPQQLNIMDQLYKPDFYEAVAKVMSLRKKYIEERTIFVESRDMIPILLGLGGRPEDLPKIAEVGNNLYHDPTLPFRRSRNGRFCIDYDTNTLRRLEFQPFALSVEEDFKRYDSGQIRRFDEVEDELQLNSIFQALFVFKAMIIHGMDIAHRPKLEYDVNKWVCTLFCLRTFTNKDVLGEPALEGVHADGVDHTMTTFLNSSNMAPNSAATFMHDMGETTGIRLDEISPKYLLGRVQHKNLLDTLMIVDHERKHSLSPVYPIDKTKEATRDMLVFFTRKPVEKTHISGSIDSLNAHKDLPMEIPLFIPGRV